MPRAERSWVKDNESDYLIDAGMWTACKESAWVLMKKRLSRARPYNIRFGTFRDGSDDWVFDVDVSRDLFCFQFSNNAYWSLHTEWELLPFWNTSRRDGFVSVAVEFDSSWSVGIEPDMDVGTLERMVNEPGARGFFLSLIKKEMNGESYVPQIYLIDRSIRRSQYERPSSYSEFHSMGRAFGFVVGEYTVVEDDLTPEMEPEMDAFDFFRAIDSVGDYWKALGLSYDRSYEDGELVEFRTWSRTSVKAYVSVLAQEEEDDMESPGKEYEGTEV
ncbi:hypothetical protein CGCF413_v007468 [Colletotrichum fructicola]|nr:hypothetical protein CGCF413_v007468 [Colletotrichum fructicola]